MKNIRDVFQDNGYSEEEIIAAMAEKENEDQRTEENDETRSIVVMLIPGYIS